MYTKEFRKVVVSMGVVPGSVWVVEAPGMVSSQREMLRTWKSTTWTLCPSCHAQPRPSGTGSLHRAVVKKTRAKLG